MSLLRYLPKDVGVMIYRILHNERVNNLNKQYTGTVTFRMSLYDNTETYYLINIYRGDKFVNTSIFNFRFDETVHNYVHSFNGNYSVANLPKRYWYTSGIHS